MYKRYRLKYLDLRHFSISNIDNLCCLRGHLFEENSSFSTLPLILCNINLQAISVLILYTSPSLCLVIFIVLQNLMDNCVNIKKIPVRADFSVDMLFSKEEGVCLDLLKLQL